MPPCAGLTPSASTKKWSLNHTKIRRIVQVCSEFPSQCLHFASTKANAHWQVLCPMAYWETRVETVLGSAKNWRRNASYRYSQGVVYFEQVCIDRRHSSHVSGKGVPQDWHAHFSMLDSVCRAIWTFKIEYTNPRKHFICGEPLKHVYAIKNGEQMAEFVFR